MLKLRGFRFAIRSADILYASHCFIKPDGTVVTPSEDHYEVIGNILEQEPISMLNSPKIHRVFYRRNFLDTYFVTKELSRRFEF